MKRRHLHARHYAGMTRDQRRGVYLILAGIWLSGVLWLVAHYALREPGPFGVPTPSTWEPWCLAVHGAFAFLSLGLAGWILSQHLSPAWRSGRSRRSGLAMVAGALSLMFSGYLLYYVISDRAREVIGVVHWVIGSAMPLVLIWHLLARRRVWRDSADRSQPLWTHLKS